MSPLFYRKSPLSLRARLADRSLPYENDLNVFVSRPIMLAAVMGASREGEASRSLPQGAILFKAGHSRCFLRLKRFVEHESGGAAPPFPSAAVLKERQEALPLDGQIARTDGHDGDSSAASDRGDAPGFLSVGNVHERDRVGDPSELLVAVERECEAVIVEFYDVRGLVGDRFDDHGDVRILSALVRIGPPFDK